jgi:hypothetical protein
VPYCDLVSSLQIIEALRRTGRLGTADEARAMLDRVIVAMKADSAGTLAKINEGAEGFRDRDLYPFCSGPDGQELQGPATDGSIAGLQFGQSVRRYLKS